MLPYAQPETVDLPPFLPQEAVGDLATGQAATVVQPESDRHPSRVPGNTAALEATAASRARREKDADAGEQLVVFDLLGDMPEWRERALCSQTDPEAFFPEKGGSTREAKRICSRCEVKSECLESAIGADEKFGIWGGLSERERRRLKRRGF